MTRRHAFSLVELLMVIVIIGILVALLIPGMASAKQTVETTQCRANLRTIWQAEAVWQADSKTAERTNAFATGTGWAGRLLSYVERRSSVFICPSRVPPSEGAVSTDTSGGDSSDGSDGDSSSGGSDGSGSTSGGSTNSSTPPQDTGCDISFDVYSNATFTTFLWNVSINSQWAKTTKIGDNTWQYQIEDRGYLVEQTGDWKYADDYKDIDVSVTYEDGRPVSIQIIQGKRGTQGYRFDLKINGELVAHNIDNYAGTAIDLRKDNGSDPADDSSGSGSDGSGGSGSGSGTGSLSYTYVPSDYGISVGAYRTNGVTAPRVDPNLFLILDFPKATADFTPGSNEAGFWDKYFIEDPDAWRRASWARTAGDWRVWQALRHFGRANVLFCDGHVESLPPRWDTEAERAQGFYLYYSSPLWAFQGR